MNTINYKIRKFFIDLKSLLKDKPEKKKKEPLPMRLKKFSLKKLFRNIFSPFYIKLGLILYMWTWIILWVTNREYLSSGFKNLQNLLIIFVVLCFIILYDEWKSPGWRIRKKKKLRNDFKEKYGYDYKEMMKERKKKHKQ